MYVRVQVGTTVVVQKCYLTLEAEARLNIVRQLSPYLKEDTGFLDLWSMSFV
jgi:hypothetical protein